MISGGDRSCIKVLKLLKFYSIHAFGPKFGSDRLVLIFVKDVLS